MQSLFLIFIFTTILLASSLKEKKLKEAVLLSNQEKHEEAVTLLKSLAEEHPTDERIFLSLGLIYKTMGKIEEAITSFEKAIQIKPSEDGFYSLALLYEAMAIHAVEKSKEQLNWYKKASSSWKNFLKQNSKETKKIETATRHLKHIKEQLQKFPGE